MPHAKPGMAALLDVAGRAAEPPDEEIAQALLGGREVGLGIHRAEDVVLRNLPVEQGDEAMEPVLADRGVDLTVVQAIDRIRSAVFPAVAPSMRSSLEAPVGGHAIECSRRHDFRAVGLWIDHTRAVIVFAEEPHRASRRVEAQPAVRYYDNVITALGSPGPVLIIGPGDTKTELQERIEQASRWRGWVVRIEPSACTSNRDILAELAERLQPQ